MFGNTIVANMPIKDIERRKKYLKEYRERNKERIREYHKNYNNTEIGRKSHRIGEWKYSGLIADDYDAIYDRYINTHECDCCKLPIKEGKGSKVMDHCHKTGKFRNVLCHNCNILRCHLDNNYQAYLRMITL
jgi:hypothetical protein